MNLAGDFFHKVRSDFARDWTEAALRWTIIAWAVFIIVLVLFVKNKWILAGILAYEVLP